MGASTAPGPESRRALVAAAAEPAIAGCQSLTGVPATISTAGPDPPGAPAGTVGGMSVSSAPPSTVCVV